VTPRPPRSELTRSQLRILLAVCTVHHRDGRATVRAVAEAVGLASMSTVHHHLVALRDAGWVTWDDGRDSTLRPLVHVVAHTPREPAGQRG
jgi:SOS-response transcriptional repressor LexA